MKKIILGLSLCFLLGGCNVSQNNLNNFPLEKEISVLTYLVLGKNGLYQGQKGENIASEYLENTISYVASSGTSLPNKSLVTSEIKDVEFVSWVKYDGKGTPSIYREVPDVNYQVLYATYRYIGEINKGEGTSDGSSIVDPDDPITESIYYLVGEGEFMGENPSWSTESNLRLTPLASDDPNIKEQYTITLTFARNDEFKIISRENSSVNWLSPWLEENGVNFSGGQSENIVCLNPGTYNIYLKFYQDGGLNIYLGLLS